MIHYVYVGHFAREGDFVRFEKCADGSQRPVVTRPVSMALVEQHLGQRGLTPSSIPEDWGLWIDDGYIVCDRFTQRRAAIDLLRCLATKAACDVADYSSQSLMSPADIQFAWESVES